MSSTFPHFPHTRRCLICEESGDVSVNEDNAVTLSKLLGCPGSVFSELLQSATYCPFCVHLIEDVGKIIADIQVLEEKLDDWKKHIEEQLKNSSEVVNFRRNGGTEFHPRPELEITSNQDVRERVIFQLQSSSLTTFVRKWNAELSPEEPTGVTRTDKDATEHFSTEAAGVTQTELILPDLDNVFEDHLDVDDDGVPSPAASYRSSQSFEEKFNVSSEALPLDDSDLTIDGKKTASSSTFGAEVEQTRLLDFVKLQEKKKAKRIQQKSRSPTKLRQHSTRIPCPFSLDCKLTINRNNEISIDAHRLRYHEGIRKCYVCKSCGEGFTGCNGLESHQRYHHHNEDADVTNISENEDENREINNEPSSQIQIANLFTESDIRPNTKSTVSELSERIQEIAESRFPIILLDKLKAEDIAVRLDVAKCRSKIHKSRRTGGKRPRPNRDSYTSRGSQLKNYKFKRISVKKSKIENNFFGEDDSENEDNLRTEIRDVPHFAHLKNPKRKYDKLADTETGIEKSVKRKRGCVYDATRIKCPIQGCSLRFNVTEEHRRQAHVRHHHQGIKKCFRCDICDIYFRELKDWQKHTSDVHTGIPAFVCKYCKMEFSRQEGLRDHVRRVHEPHKIRHKCKLCNKEFIYKYALDVHNRTHTKERPYMCEICSETFRSPEYLKYHQTKKHKDSPYNPLKCKYCEKQLSAPASLRAHIKKLHTKEVKLKCSVCDYGAHSQSELDRHFTSRHTDERNYKCTYCPSTFKVNAALTVHLRNHTGERPYKCKTCGKDFISSQYVKRHELIHSNEQCHTCEVCGKTFPVKNYLYIHMRSHNKTNRKRPTTAPPVIDRVTDEIILDTTAAAPLPNSDTCNNEQNQAAIIPTFPFGAENNVAENPPSFLLI